MSWYSIEVFAALASPSGASSKLKSTSCGCNSFIAPDTISIARPINPPINMLAQTQLFSLCSSCTCCDSCPVNSATNVCFDFLSKTIEPGVIIEVPLSAVTFAPGGVELIVIFCVLPEKIEQQPELVNTNRLHKSNKHITFLFFILRSFKKFSAPTFPEQTLGFTI